MLGVAHMQRWDDGEAISEFNRHFNTQQDSAGTILNLALLREEEGKDVSVVLGHYEAAHEKAAAICDGRDAISF